MTQSQLTVEDKKIISKWANSRKSSFTRLYKASVDGGCNATTFHQKCDGKGPTVIVAYNNTGYTFGAYTSQSFTTKNCWLMDTAIVLFQLRVEGKKNYCKYPAGQQSAIYNQASYGPSFGSGQTHTEEIRFFSGDNPVGNDGVITCNSLYTNFTGTIFEHNLTWLRLGGNNTNLFDLEVYKVEPANLLSKDEPWRKTTIQWHVETKRRLIQELISYKPVPTVDVPLANILLIGQVGAGKSSFFNTINSVFQGYITAQAVAGGSTHSLTTRYRTYRPRIQRGSKKLNFQLCDTMGLEEDAGIDVSDFAHILSGRIPDRFQFYPGAGVANDSPNLKTDNDLKDKIHVAAFVVDGSTIQVMPMIVLHKLKEIKKQVDKCGIPSAVILTKVDEVCRVVSEDVTELYHSPDIRDCVDEVAEKFGIPRSQVMIVKNYENETEVEVPKDILTLVALQQLLRLADNFYDEQIDILGLPDIPANEERATEDKAYIRKATLENGKHKQRSRRQKTRRSSYSETGQGTNACLHHEHLKEEMNPMKTEKKYMLQQVDELHAHQRQNNVRIFGLSTLDTDRMEETCKERVISFFKEKLGVQTKVRDISRAYPIGKEREGKKQIVVNFANWEAQTEVMRNVAKLKGTNYFITDGPTRDQYLRRKAKVIYL